MERDAGRCIIGNDVRPRDKHTHVGLRVAVFYISHLCLCNYFLVGAQSTTCMRDDGTALLEIL